MCSNKDTIGSWQDVADLLNRILNTEYTESKFRKQYRAFQKMLNANESKFIDDDNYLKEIQIQKDELYKLKRRVFDQRREYNKVLVSDARADHLMEMIVESANKLNKENH